MAEAMKQIRSELGNDAVILNSKEMHTGGFFGFFQKRQIEVIAAVDRPLHVQTPEKQKPTDQLFHEVNDLKTKVVSLSASQREQGPAYPEPLKLVKQLLNNQEINESNQNEILAKLFEKWYSNGANATIDEVYRWLETELLNGISSVPFGGITFKKKYINVIGPTGVGKTTTLAKIAAECVIKHKKKIAFITTDTYRIAAIDQLKTYAKILNVPMEVCYTIEDFKKSALKFNEFDLILIDTAGRNFRNRQYVEDLRQIIDFDHDMETFLVLSLTSKQRDMEDIYEQFSTIEIDKFVFTKADETSSYGAMYNLIIQSGKGVAYLTNGQNVPDDIVEGKPSLIAKTIIGAE